MSGTGRLAGSAAIVTGAGGGLGEAIAKRFAEEGAKVAILDVSEKNGTAAAERINSAGGEAAFWKADVTDEKNLQEVFASVYERFGRIDILVNNAGITGPQDSTETLSEADFDLVLRIDTKGPFLCTKSVIPYMKKSGKGSIINMSSITALCALGGAQAYAVAKSALIMMTKNDAIDLAKYNIRVNSVHPATVLTDLVRNFGNNFEGGWEAFQKVATGMVPMGKFALPVDIANAALFLASDEAQYITGIQLPVDGGMLAR